MLMLIRWIRGLEGAICDDCNFEDDALVGGKAGKNVFKPTS